MDADKVQPDPRDAIIAELRVRNAQLEARIAKLEALLAAATRAGKRQAAPFSKGPPKADPKTPGRKPGENYGTKAFRVVPPVIDEVLEAPLPNRCDCGGTIVPDSIEHQYQTEIPRKPIHRQFNIHVGHCRRCGGRVQGRHPLQTSDALGCCASPEDYDGTLIHDGFKSYQRFFAARHQTCNNHLLRRCHELLETATGGAVLLPRRVKAILREGLEVRDRRDAGKISARTAARKAGQLQERMVKLTEPVKTNPDNERFAAHLFRQQSSLFTYLRIGGIDATNYRAEQALKMPIVNRKVWGGNRTEDGAAAQGILASMLKTLALSGRQAVDWISGLLRNPDGTPLLIPLPAG